MAVVLNIPKQTQVQVKYKISEETKDLLDLYLEAGREVNPGVEDDRIIDALFQYHFSKDSEFKKWLKVKKAQVKDANNSSQSAGGN